MAKDLCGSVVWAQTDLTIAAYPRGDSGPDALEHQTLVELTRLCSGVTRHGPRGDSARAFAARMRTMAVYHRAVGRSDAISRRIASLVSKRGHDVVAMAPVNIDLIGRTLQHYGIDAASIGIERFMEPVATTRSATLDMLVAGGPAALWEHVATVFERASASIDPHVAAVRAVRVAQVDASWRAAVADEVSSSWYAGSLLCPLADAAGSCHVACLAAAFGAAVHLSSGPL